MRSLVMSALPVGLGHRLVGLGLEDGRLGLAHVAGSGHVVSLLHLLGNS